MNNTMFFRFERFALNRFGTSANDYLNSNKDEIGNFPPDDRYYRFSQVLDSLLYYHVNNPNDNEKIVFQHIDSTENNGYIIPVAIHYHPNDWTDMENGIKVQGKKSIFEDLNPLYLRDMQAGKAILLLDQSVEGSSASWVWQWFHSKTTEYNIPPESIIYLTGDQSCEDTYSGWCEANKVLNRLKVISSISLSMYIKRHYLKRGLNIKFDTLLEHKEANKDSLYLFDSTNMRPRPQRILNYLHLINANLADKGNISMPSLDNWKNYIKFPATDQLQQHGLPTDIISKMDPSERKAVHEYVQNTDNYYDYVERILDSMYKNSWLSVITESSYFKYEHSVFISEKTFKPIACMQPFVIVGSKGVLKYLHQLGYKSFHPFIDESYDDADDNHRFLAIMETLKKIDQITDKVSWYNSMRDILEHNHKLFMDIGNAKSIEHQKIAKYYFEYFKEKDVQNSL